MTEQDFIKEIWNLKLGDKDKSFDLYSRFCAFLNSKYGMVDKDYDDNPTTRGNEWLDIHHVKEYELDDIAKRTDFAKRISKTVSIQTIRLQEKRTGNKFYSLEELKPYNEKRFLVYANKIEHFLLHYLIESFRGRKVLSGGPNYLWDSSVALELYGFYSPTFKKLQEKKEEFYSLMDVREITKLYKNLVDWKKWDIYILSDYWMSYKSVIGYMKTDKVSNVRDKEEFFEVLKVLKYKIPKDLKKDIIALPYLGKVVSKPWGECLRIKNIDFTLDGKVVKAFLTDDKESYKVPEDIIEIADGAFSFELKKVTIPNSVEVIGDKAFKFAHKLETVNYLGTQEMWDKKFSNVILNGVKLICKKKM